MHIVRNGYGSDVSVEIQTTVIKRYVTNFRVDLKITMVLGVSSVSWSAHSRDANFAFLIKFFN